MKLKIDLHVHTIHSKDAFTELELVALKVREKGLDGVAITDHNHITNAEELGIIGIPGVEVSTTEGHILGLGVTHPISRGLPPETTIEEIWRQSGIAVIPHPYDLVSPSVNPESVRVRPDALETVNSSTFMFNLATRKAKKKALRLRLPAVGGSDSHLPETIGDAFSIIDSQSAEISDILDAIRDNRTIAHGKASRIGSKIKKIWLQARKCSRY